MKRRDFLKVTAGVAVGAAATGDVRSQSQAPAMNLKPEKGARLRVVPITDDGELRMDEFEALISDRTKIVGVVHVSNALGTVNPIADIVRIAHSRGVPVLVDGAHHDGDLHGYVRPSPARAACTRR